MSHVKSKNCSLTRSEWFRRKSGRAAESRSAAEALGRTRFCFHRFFCSILFGRSSVERLKEALRHARDFVNGSVERGFVAFGRLVEATDLADELKGRGSDFFLGDGWIEIE